jgi:hypothetical protein
VPYRTRGDRTLLVEADSPQHYRSSTIQLERERGPSTHRVVLRALPPGTYHIRAELRQVGHAVRSDPAVVKVIGH